MNTPSQNNRSQSRWPGVAIVMSLVAAFITAGVVSWATPDGNLVVTLVPALIVGVAVLGIATWRIRRGRLKQ